jgi:hypothetical protein
LKKYFSFVLFFICCFTTTLSFAQTDTVINGKHYKIVDDSKPVVKKKKTSALDSTFVISNKKYKYYNSWLSGGGGIQKNLTRDKSPGFAGGVDFNFHLKQHYFQIGALLTGKQFGTYNNYQFHVCYGKRFEDKNIHLAGFVGLSYSTGYQSTQVDSITFNTRAYKQPGIYVEGQAVKKLAYDVGVGVSLFGDWNQEQTILGAKLILYFSGAYKGKQNAYYKDKTEANF